MNTIQSNNWNNMIKAIDQYLLGNINYSEVVKNLEGLLDACDFKDNLLVNEWYQYWQPLEITNAVKGDSIEIAEVKDNLEAMRNFLVSKIKHS